MEPLTEEQRKKLKQKVKACTFKKRKSRMTMQKNSRKRNRG